MADRVGWGTERKAFKLDILKLELLEQGWRTFLRARAIANFEDQNNVLESFIIIINYRIIINAYYNCN